MRNNDGYITFIHQFAEDVLVVCPSCSGKAMVHTNGYVYPKGGSGDVKVVCASCGFNKMLQRNPTVVVNGVPRKSFTGKHLIFGAPVDPFFHLPLWLTDKVLGNLLWAYNPKHLFFLKEFVEARLRERNGKKNTNASIGSRLPKWMTSRHNRDIVLKAIERLITK
jgi:hypothetical protein